MKYFRRLLLSPFTALYSSGVALRDHAFRTQILHQVHSALPVICVGNAVAGGSGKTPFTQFLATTLLEAGIRPVLLLRGYGGWRRGPHLVAADDVPASVGDEAILHRDLLGSDVPVIVSRDRVMGAGFVEVNQLGNCILLDDGYQHRKLARDLNILLLDISSAESIDKWRSGWLLPSGYLREPLEKALERASCVVFVNRTVRETTEAINGSFGISHPRSYSFQLSPSHLEDIHTCEHLPLEFLAEKEIGVITAIAGPATFLSMLENLNARVAFTHIKRDHYHFTPNDWKVCVDKFSGIFITTSKDAVKLRTCIHDKGRAFVLHLQPRFISAGQHDDFNDMLEEVLVSKLHIHEISTL